MLQQNTAILVVSFGTSHDDTCKKTIEAIEDKIREAYPEHPFYRAWTSEIIRRIKQKRDGVTIMGVREAMEQMKRDGVTSVIIQPTHVLNGIENEYMENEIRQFEESFSAISVGKPLLTTQEDSEKLVEMMIEEWNPTKEKLVVFMGHGTEHHSNFVYSALNYQFHSRGFDNILVGTVEGFPDLNDVITYAKKYQPEKIILTPFMIVAGDHAKNDLAGEDDSWRKTLEDEGFQVECVLKGLGEYEGVQKQFLEHLSEAFETDTVE